MAEPDGNGRPDATSSAATPGGGAAAAPGAHLRPSGGDAAMPLAAVPPAAASRADAPPDAPQPDGPQSDTSQSGAPPTYGQPVRSGRPPRPAWVRRGLRGLGRHPVTTVPEPNRSRRGPGGAESEVLTVLRIPEFRRLWAALALSSFGDWMGLLATTALVTQFEQSFSGQAFALGSLLIVRLLPALIFGPLAGAIADRLDRRRTMVVADVIRCGLFISIPVVGTLQWLLIASFLVECVSLLWIPAKEASVPHLVPRERLATANTISLITTYGSAPIGAAVFSLITSVSQALGSGVSFFRDSSLDIVLYFNGLTFLVSAVVIFGLRTIGKAERTEHSAELGFWASITEGWRFVGRDKLLRGLVVGILGGFAGAGCVIALGPLYAKILGGGESAYGVLFGAVFVGLAAGFALGPKLLGDYSRTRLFGLAVTGAGITLVFVAIIPNLVLACILVVAVGTFAGIAWVTGYTLLQAEVADELRGRTFALVQSLVRIELLLVLAAAPAVVGLIGSHEIHLWGDINVRADGVTAVLLAGGLLAVSVGLFAYRQMDDRAGVAVLPELWNALRGKRTRPTRPRHAGLFVAVEGGEGAGKSTQVDLLVEWLATTGREVVVTRESGGTPVGASLRKLLLDPSVRLHARTEALLNAADRAEHVARVIEPALARGAVVVSDCYVDSSIAYQGAGRRLGADELGVISQWATHALLPDVTILLDLPVEAGLVRALRGSGGGASDVGAEDNLAFHERVRDGFRTLAEAEPGRYVKLDASLPPDALHARIRSVVGSRLKLDSGVLAAL